MPVPIKNPDSHINPDDNKQGNTIFEKINNPHWHHRHTIFHPLCISHWATIIFKKTIIKAFLAPEEGAPDAPMAVI